MKFTGNFYNTADFSQKEINKLITLALDIKKGKKIMNLSGKILALLFFNPSLRTRASFASAMQRLNGRVIDVPVKNGKSYTFEFEKGVVMDGQKSEHIIEAAGVLSRYCDAIAVRASDLVTTSSESAKAPTWKNAKKDTVLKSFMEYATVPVINMESNVYHPCQGLGDMVTIKEKFGSPKGKKYILTWTHHPKALPVATPHSQVLAACDLGMRVTVVHPKGWELDNEIMEVATMRVAEAGGELHVSNSMEEAFIDADAVCAKSWGALKYCGKWKEEKELRNKLKQWIVDEEKMKLTNNAYFMHCLPVRRNIVVTDDVLDSNKSIVIDQAENRMWAQMALLYKILGEDNEN